MTGTGSSDGKGADLWPLFRAIATGDRAKAARLLADSPRLALNASPIGATRNSSMSYYFKETEHYVYAGDTALHVASAAYRTDIAKELVAHGADVSARNRRGGSTNSLRDYRTARIGNVGPESAGGHRCVLAPCRCRPKRGGQEWSDTAASGGSDALCGCGSCSSRERCRSAAQEWKWIHTAPPGRQEHRPLGQRDRCRGRAATGDHSRAGGAGRPPGRHRWSRPDSHRVYRESGIC